MKVSNIRDRQQHGRGREPQEKNQIQVLGKALLKQAEEKKSQSNSKKDADLQ